MGGRLALVLVAVCAVACARAPAAPTSHGVVDLSGWARDAGPVVLAGGWRFYWKKLVSDDSVDPGIPDAVGPLGPWNGTLLRDGSRVSGFGFATYRATVGLPAWAKTGQETLAVHVNDFSSAYRLVIRDATGALLAQAESGRVGVDREHALAVQQPITVRFAPASDLRVTIQVSNWDHARGGAWGIPLIGRAAEVDRKLMRELVLDLLVIGILLMIASHHLAMFALRRQDRAPLWFALFCLALAVRAVVVRHYAQQAWPGWWSYALQLKLSYLTFYGAMGLLAGFLSCMFAGQVDRRLYDLSKLMSLAFSLLVIVTPPSVYTHTLTLMQAYSLVGIVWVLWHLATLIRRRNRLALLVALGFSVCAAAILYDIWMTRFVTGGTAASHYGMAGFVFFQSLVLAMKNERAQRELELRNTEVQRLNESLRRSIGERSRELQEALNRLGSRQKKELMPGDLLAGRYRVERKLGQGGMGEVYEVTRVSDGQRLAVKRVRDEWDKSSLKRFAREVELATRVVHPNVVSLVEFEVTDAGDCFLVMELVTGGSLEQHRPRYGDVAWALPVLRQLADALAAIHGEGIVHRDLKPANVLVSGEVVKLADFGVAGLKQSATSVARMSILRLSEVAETMRASPEITHAGALLGSPQYMAPELVAGAERATARSDVFSFGLVAFELLTGRRPFDPAVVLQRAEGRTPDPAPPFGAAAPSLDAGLAELLDRCLRLEPNARPRIDELRHAFGLT